MTLRLTVESGAWHAHVHSVVASYGDVLPVVKGNGYGFGRAELMPHAHAISRDVAVGTVHELADVSATQRPFVLTPVGVGVDSIARRDAVLAITSTHDLGVLKQLGAANPVVIKIVSSMHRYGIAANEAGDLRKRAEAAGHQVVAWSVHLPLAGSDDSHASEATAIASSLASDLPLHLSHIGAAVQQVRASIAHHVVMRTGTHLWLGDKSMVALHADVIAVRTTTFSAAGYRASKISTGASTRLVMVGCGSSHGVGALSDVGALGDSSSPFHFARQRLAMLEPPHMHTTMLSVERDPCPQAGDWVDVQQPMTRVYPDVIAWR
jgi:alanine racemase